MILEIFSILIAIAIFILIRVWLKHWYKKAKQQQQKDVLLVDLLNERQQLRSYFNFFATFDKQHFIRCMQAYAKQLRKKETNNIYQLPKDKKWKQTKKY